MVNETKKSNQKLVAKTGNEAMAEAMRQIKPDVVAAYPITPATEIVQIFSQFVADGLVPTEFVPVESEHSAMSACIGAASAGARTMTGTSSQGLALMTEMLYIASGLRLPIVMAVVNRSLSSPINIHGDHADTMSVRDSGWIQIYSENSQEAYDNLIQAVKIAENPKLRLPVMVTTDGFIISHCLEAMQIISDEEVTEFVGTYKPERYLLDVDHPYTLGAMDLQDYYFEHRHQVSEAMKIAPEIIKEVARQFSEKFGRTYDLIEKYRCEDAERIIIAIGSVCGTAKDVVDNLRDGGEKVGLVKVRVFRPFPAKEIISAIQKAKAVAILDRADANNGFSTGPLLSDVTSAMYLFGLKIPVIGYVYGLGGRDITTDHLTSVYQELKEITEKQPENFVRYINLRE